MNKKKKILYVNKSKEANYCFNARRELLSKDIIPLSVKHRSNHNHSLLSNIENPELKSIQKNKNKAHQSIAYLTPKNTTKAFNMLFSQLAITNENTQQDDNPKPKLIEIVLPDQFKNLLLEPCEYHMRYNPCYLVEYSLDIFSYLEMKQVMLFII